MHQLNISKSRKWFYSISIFVIIICILPYTIYGFRLKDLSSSSDDNDNDQDSSNIKSTKKTDYRDVGKNKPRIQFRKIVKIVHVDDDGTETEENLSDDNDENIADDNDNIEFEKVHRSDFNKPQSIYKTIAEQDDDDGKEDEIVIEDSSSQKSSFSYLFDIFTFIGSIIIPSPPPEEESNSLINWIQSFIETKVEKPKEPEKFELSWIMSYMNRWPFNVFIPFEQADSKIWIPPPMPAPIEPENIREPLSQEHFDYLLYHFPNFVLKINDVSEIDCRNQLLILQRQLRGHKLWTLQMLDSSAKIPAGILRGNTNQFGDFESCTQIRTFIKINPRQTVPMKGKYCLAHIDLKYLDSDLKVPVYLAHGKGMWKGHISNPGHLFPRYTTINWGICVPNQCSNNEIFKMLENSLKPYNSTGVHFHIKVNEDDCFVKKDEDFISIVFNSRKILFALGFYSILIFVVMIATMTDYWEVINEWGSQYLKKGTEEDIEDANSSKDDNEAVEQIQDEASKGSEKEEINDVNKQDTKQENNFNDVFQKYKNDFELIKTQIASGINKVLNSIQKKHFWTVMSYIEYLYNQIPEQYRATIAKLSHKILLSFSLKRTIPSLINIDPEVDILLINTLKIICTFMLYLFMKFLMLGHLSIINRDDMVKNLSNPFSILLRTPLIYFDILLLIAGLLSSREMCKQLEQKIKISVLKIIAGKLIRSLPTLLSVLFFQSWILPQLGSGPLWSNLIQANADLCEKNLWRNFFGIQNLINVEESCSPFTMQLALDLQLLFIGCLIVWLYYSHEDIGFGIYGVFHAISVAARYSHTNGERLSSVLFHGMNVSKFYRTSNILFSSPIDRATTYLIGIGAGIFIWTSNSNEIYLPSSVSKLAWTSSILGVLWCFWYPWHGTKLNFIYDPIEAAVYAAWAPIFLSLSLAWIIFASTFTSLSINKFMNSKLIIFLSKITYPMQLIIFSVIMYNTALNKEPIRFQFSNLIDFGEIIIIICVATILAIIIDQPFQNIRKILLETEFYVVSSHEEEDKEGDEDHHVLSNGKSEDLLNEEEEIIEEKNYENETNRETNAEFEENWHTESDLEQNEPAVIADDEIDKEIEVEQEEDEEEEAKEDEEEQNRTTAQSFKWKKWNFDDD